MVSFNFKPEFVPMIESGAKIQTIRSSLRCMPGDTMHLYTGLRTKECRLIMKRVCLASMPIVIMPEGIEILTPAHQGLMDGSRQRADRFARADGFSCYDTMYDWFYEMYGKERFYGFVHRWSS